MRVAWKGQNLIAQFALLPDPPLGPGRSGVVSRGLRNLLERQPRAIT
jgi:hypothetical protein